MFRKFVPVLFIAVLILSSIACNDTSGGDVITTGESIQNSVNVPISEEIYQAGEDIQNNAIEALHHLENGICKNEFGEIISPVSCTVK